MNPFSITKDFRKKKQRKKSTDEDPNLVFKSTFETKAKVFKETEESEESKSNILSLKKQKKDQISLKSRDSLISESLHPYMNPEIFPKENNQLLLIYESKITDFSSEGFSQEIEGYLRKMTLNKKHTKIATKYPLLKVFKTILKKFMFNDLETTFWSYFLEQNDWNYMELKDEAIHFPDFMNLSEIVDPYEFKTILLYLTLSGYAIKQYLNDTREMEMYEAHLTTLFPPFIHIFNNWIRRNTHSLQFVPRKLNFIYKKYTMKTKELIDQQYHNDYNSLVDAIIQISPPYNYDKIENHPEDHIAPNHSQPIYITRPANVTIVHNQNSNNAYSIGGAIGRSNNYQNDEFMKKPSPPISQDYENQNKLVLHKEQSNISFDNNNFFESLNLGRVESKNFSNIFMDPDNKNDNIHYPEFDPIDIYGKNSSNLNNNNNENPAVLAGFKKCTRKGVKNEIESQVHNGNIEEEPELEPLNLVKDTSTISQSKLSLKKNISQFLQ